MRLSYILVLLILDSWQEIIIETLNTWKKLVILNRILDLKSIYTKKIKENLKIDYI